MKNVLKISLFVFSLSLMSACTSGLEERIADLERRVAELERGGVTTAMPNKNNQNTPVVSEPEEKPEGPLPTITFEEKVHDFGKVKEGEVVTKIFKFTNTGEAPLIISNASSSCGCTVPEYPKDTPIAPGESGELKVQYNSRGNQGKQSKVVRLTANTWPKVSTLTIKADVEKKATDADNDGPLKN